MSSSNEQRHHHRRPPPRGGSKRRTWCPYLDTIDRTVLDFDSSDRCCSVTLESSSHIYACLVCGRFLRGRGKQTPAYRHSVDEGHRVFVHLTYGTFWCLPEDYEIFVDDDGGGGGGMTTMEGGGGGDGGEDDVDVGDDMKGNSLSLLDIRRALRPRFSRAEVSRLDDNVELVRDLYGRRYLPGYVGLNSLGGETDHVNAVVQALAHVRPLRDYFLLAPLPDEEGGGGDVDGDVDGGASALSPLARSFSLLLRNMWSSHRFKSSVDPYEFVRAVSTASDGKYGTGGKMKNNSNNNNGGGGGGGTDAGEFLSWLLHHLHLGVGGGERQRRGRRKGKKRSRRDDGERIGNDGERIGSGGIVHDTFMGRVEVTTIVRRRRRRGEEEASRMLTHGGGVTTSAAATDDDDDNDDDNDDDRDGSDDDETVERRRARREALVSLANETIIAEEETTIETDFLQLTLDIPEKPLFKDADGGLVIPQEPLVNVMRKFDGVTFAEALAGAAADARGGGGAVVSRSRRYRLRRLPDYLILHLSRFRRNGFTVEKNPTIVMFPVKNFDLSSYVFPEGGRDAVPTREELERMSTKDLKGLLIKYGRADLVEDAVEKEDLLRHCLDFVSTSLPDLLADKYDLVANITHDVPIEVGREGRQRNPLEEGSYRCHVQHVATGQWYEIQDLAVRETMPQLISVSESYLLIFERKGAAAARSARL
ncbi:hypothetical protein ACHAW5_005713 [Stephanodiscus triporus]|uniref:Ubiquitinyl hydrolase 1 n=1 Tax=Stephanodiscus triporus TaxID=2934178 RepID=A0ABD3NY31_9STRA